MAFCSFLQNVLYNVEVNATTEDDEITPNREYFLRQESFIKSKPRISFTQEDLHTLDGCNWLSDEVVNSYLNILRSRSEENIGSTNTFFINKLERGEFDEALNWEGIRGEKINIYDKFLIPIHAGMHWIIACCDFKNNELDLLDSFGNSYTRMTDLINTFLEFQGITPLPVKHPQVPRQYNGYDCGVFLLSNARCILLNNGVFDYTQADIPNIRKRIKSELLSESRK